MKIVNRRALPTDPTILRHIRNAGIALIIIGIIAIALPHFATLAVELLLAWTLVIGGAIGLFFGWRGREFLTWWHTGVTFLLTLILGVVFLIYPFSGIQTMTVFVVGLFCLQGIASLLFAFRLRSSNAVNWIWMIFSAISSLLIAGLIMSGWPGSADWAIGLLVGFNMLATGLSLVSITSKAKTE